MDSCIPLPRDKEFEETVSKIQDWAAVNGLILRTSHQFPVYQLELAPMTFLPSPFPRLQYEKVKRVQTILNRVIHQVAYDTNFLREALKNTLAVDDFTARLFAINETVLAEGRLQPLSLGLFRFDYLLDAWPSGNDACSLSVKQVEMNTISSSFSCLAKQMTRLHRYVLSELGHKELVSAIPDNCPNEGFAKAIIAAFKCYDSENAVIAFVVEPFVKMIGDHKQLDCEILRQYPDARIIRRTFQDLYDRGSLQDGALFIDGHEVAVAYYRVGYAPDGYPNQQCWDARLLVERSRCIKCPSIQYQLAGTKKVQQLLAKKDVLRKYVSDLETVEDILEVFTGLYSLDEGDEGDAAIAMISNDPDKFVLKPQREGGGFNVYGDDITHTLRGLKSSKERCAYILMDRINPPSSPNYLLRAGQKPILTDVVSELGIYGIIVGSEDEILLNEEVGHLLRTKPSTTNEGGVVSGYAFLDGMILV